MRLGKFIPLNRKYSIKIRDKAVQMVERRRTKNPRDRTIFREVAAHFEVGEQSLRLWVRDYDSERLNATPGQAKVGGTVAPGDVHAELKALHRKIEKLQAENDVLKRAFVAFSSEWSK